jgi:Fe-S-cluster containining protein
VNQAELEALSTKMELKLPEFMRRYTEDRVVDGATTTSIKNRGGGCALLDQDRKTCRVHEVKPLQCRSYPFWSHSLVGEAEFEAEKERCPGIGESGEEISAKTIIREMVIGQIHARGVGENWTYEEATSLIKEAAATDPDLLSEFAADFFAGHSSRLVHQAGSLRVVDSTTDRKTARRLEFLKSLAMTQTEVFIGEDGQVDHSQLALPVHRALAHVVNHAYGGANKNSSVNKLVLIGGGACALPSHIMHTYQSPPSIDVVEPNAEVSSAAEQYFGARFAHSGGSKKVEEGMTLHQCMGDEYLGNTALAVPGSAAAVVVDAMDSLPLSFFTGHEQDENQPEHVAPAPSILQNPSALMRVLADNGILAVNLMGPEHYLVAIHRILTHGDGGKDELSDPLLDHLLFTFDSSPNSVLIVAKRGESGSRQEQDQQALFAAVAACITGDASLGPVQASRWVVKGDGVMKEPFEVVYSKVK